MSFNCLYQGRQNECHECGGYSDPRTAIDGRFCTDDCADSYAENLTRMEASEKARRDAEDAYGEQVARLREQGWDYKEIDDLLADMP